MTMNLGSTGATALLRGAYNALGAGAVSFLTCYATTNETRSALIVGAITALGALGFRSGIEGLADASRDAAGKVLPGDVGQRSTSL